jgi:hypothetical protein
VSSVFNRATISNLAKLTCPVSKKRLNNNIPPKIFSNHLLMGALRFSEKNEQLLLTLARIIILFILRDRK